MIKTVTIQQLLSCQPVFSKLIEKDVDTEIAWKLYNLIEEIDSSLEVFTKVLKKIQKKYMEKAIDPNNPDNQDYYQVPQDKMNDFMKEYTIATSQEVTIDLTDLVLDDFKKFDSLSVKNLILIDNTFFKEVKSKSEEEHTEDSEDDE